MKIPIALQLYSVRNVASQDLFGVIERVARMGYDGVEFAGYYGNDPAEIRKALDDNGLKVEGTHTALQELENNFDATVEIHKTLGCNWAIIPWIAEDQRNSDDACRATAERLSALVEKLRPLGMRTGFHCHAGDMVPLDKGRSAWDLFAENTPDDFILQYDTANGMAGGADPVKPIADWVGRNASVHLKGYAGQHGAIIGEDDVPWQRVFEAAENGGGVQWYVVEHEEDSPDALEAVDKCLQNLRAMGK
jgi:sugar phosphate isomerase/epimerase